MRLYGRRPKFTAEMRMIPYENSFLVDGGPQLRVLDVSGNAELFRLITGEADGTKTVEEIAHLHGYSSERLHGEFHILAELGLVSSAEGLHPPRGMSAEALAFAKRALRELTPEKTVVSIVQMLESFRLRIHAEDIRVASMARGILMRNGIQTAECGAAGPGTSRRELDLYLFPSIMSLIRDIPADHGGRALIAQVDTDDATLILRSQEWSMPLRRDIERRARDPRQVPTWLMIKAVASVVHWLTLNVVGGHSPLTIDERRIALGGTPGTHATDPKPSEISPAIRFEESLKETRYRERVTGEILEGLGQRNAMTMHGKCEYSEVIPLDSSIAPLLSEGETLSVLDPSVRDLANILKFSCGARDDAQNSRVRWCPSAGNLGSTRIALYVHSHPELPRGFFFYDEEAHALVRFRSNANEGYSTDELADELVGNSGIRSSITVILIGDVSRLYPKYGSFSYRLVLQDGGTLLAQMQALAREMGFNIDVAQAWSEEQFESLLNLREGTELVTLVARISTNERATPKATTNLYDIEEKLIPLPQASKKNRKPVYTALESLSEICAYSRLGVQQGVAPQMSARKIAESPIALDFIRGRKTVREYGSDPMALDAVRILCSAAVEQADPRIVDCCEFFVIARSVEGVTPGIFHLQRDQLVRISPFPSESDVSAFYVQPAFASAPCSIWLCGNLERAERLLGQAGHRYLLIASSHMCMQMWMTAHSMGLQGGMIGGVLSQVAADYLNAKVETRLPLIAFTCGREKADVQ